jgi:hypothetical protein
MCIFTSKREPYVRPFNDPPSHRSYYSARPDGLNATELTIPDEGFRRRSRASRDFVVVQPRRSREIREYDVSRAIEYRRSAESIGLPRGYSREVRYLRES